MPRQIKVGLDYLPIDVNMDTDDKIQLIEAEIPDSFGMIVKLLMKIYKNGYYLEWNEKTSKLFAKNNNRKFDVINNFINVCINEELFNIKLYNEFKILTSEGIQRRYFNAISRRKEITVHKNIVLIDIDSINVDINLIDDYRSTQSKVKKRKVKKVYSANFLKFWDLYNKKTSVDKSYKIFEKLSKSKIEKIFETLPAYIEATPEVQFRKNPSTYLNQESWNDVIPEFKTSAQVREEQEDAEINRQFEAGLL